MTSNSSSSFPPLVAVFLTHFDDTKGQSVLYYKSYDETKCPSGTIEHASLPSGLHLMEEDFFAFRHGEYPAMGIFRSRTTANTRDEDGDGAGGSKPKGRGRRMATFGVVFADQDTTDEVFGLKEPLGEAYDRIESLGPSAFTPEGQARLEKLLDGIWEEYKSEPKRKGEQGRQGGYRRTIDGGVSLSEDHPLGYLPELVRILGPQIVTVYKAALSGRRILLYSQPPLLRMSAFAYCISAMSLLPRHLSLDLDVDGPGEADGQGHHEGVAVVEWIGQIGLMDLEGLYQRQGPWVATTSDKILLSHTKIYDLSIDLSNPIADLQITSSSPGSSSKPGHRPISYSFGDIPLYRTLRALSLGPGNSVSISNGNGNGNDNQQADVDGTADPGGTNTSQAAAAAAAAAGDDWWMTLYDLMDRVWSLCTGVCEYAIGKGRVGEISLGVDRDRDPRGDGEEEETRLLDDEDDDDDEGADGEEDGDEDEREMNSDVGKGRMIMRQLYHNTHHLHQRLDQLRLEGDNGGARGITKAQARRLTGQWIVSEDDIRFWTDLSRRWGILS